jgi:hypothetical protein
VTSGALWQKLIWIVMFLVVLEGALRKWVLPGFQAQLFFVKDALLIAAYIGFLASSSKPGAELRVIAPLRILVTLSFVYFTLELLNPNSPSLLVSVSGLKSYLLYMPLAFVVPYMFSSTEDLEKKLRTYAFLMIPFAALGLVQFSFPPDHWINGYLSHDSENLRIGDLFGGEVVIVRSIGTFSYIGGYTAFLTVTFYLAAGLVAKNRWRISGNYWPLILLVTSLAAMFTTGSRAPIWGLIATCPLILWIWNYARLLSITQIAKMVAVIAVIGILAQLLASDAFDAYSSRADKAADTSDRLLSPITEAYGALGVMGPLGMGMGTTSGGALTIMGTREFWWLNGMFFEIETARVLQETGIIGFILVYAARLWLLMKAITLGIRFRTPLYSALSGVVAGLFVQDMIGFVINNATVGIYHWFAAGLLFAMYRLEAEHAVRTQKSRQLYRHAGPKTLETRTSSAAHKQQFARQPNAAHI